jgi:tetratricopeptide (TPR) repeat protein
MYLVDGQYSLAQEHLDRANAIWARLFPPDHPNVLYGKNTQVTLYYKQGQYQEARDLGLQLVKQARRKLGPEHPALTVMLANVGYSEQKLRLHSEAAECFREAIAIEEAVNRRDPYLAELLSSYAAVLRQEHRKPEAKQLELRAKAILAASVR